MAQKKIHTIILILCFAMLLPTLVACSDDKTSKKDPDFYADYYDNSSRERTSGNLPSDIDLKGETVGIFYSQWLELDVEGEDETNDVVYTSIYERNIKVKKWLNVDFEYYPATDATWQGASKEIVNLINSQDESVDIIIATSNSIIQEKLYSYFLDMSASTYLELDQPWWNYDAIYETSVDGKVFQFLFGDMIFSSITGCGAIYYNKSTYARLNPDKGPDYLYEMVLNKTWTLEQFYYISQKAYEDVNGNQVRDDDDKYGFMLQRYAEPIHYFANGCGVEYYKRLKNGYPKITINSTRSVEFCELLERVIYENKGAYLLYPNQIGAEIGHENDFSNGKYMFALTTLSSSLGDNMREMEQDYGIIPYPLWDSDQEDYITLVANGSALACVPQTVALGGNYDRVDNIIAPVLEALSIESYRSVTLNFYELALKSAYTRDDVASQMIDLIVNTSTKNFVYEYGSSLNSIGSIFSKCMENRSKFSTVYDSIGDSANVLLQELMTDYNKLFG